MSTDPGYRLPRLCLPRGDVDLRKWAVIACDQFAAEREYWQALEREVGAAPSTLHLIYPEVYLGAGDAAQRIARIHATMRAYLAQGLLVEHAGAVYVERSVGGRTRRGLMLELDLEHYDFGAASTSLIRPTEGTLVDRLAPRIAVRRGAALELPHVVALIDDPQHTVIEPLARAREALTPLYATDLMADGGHVAGWAVDPAHAARATAALDALAQPQAFARRYGVAVDTPVMLFPIGDGNHSLAAAKAVWNELRPRAGPDHPGRWALVEVVNLHDPALELAPIHRLLCGVATDLRGELARRYGSALRCREVDSVEQMRALVAAAPHAFGLIGPGARVAVVEIAGVEAALVSATLQPFVEQLLQSRSAAAVEFIHGDDTLARLAQRAGNLGLHLPPLDRSDLLRRVVCTGPLPRKTFSLGSAREKRYYLEARRITPR